MSSRAIVCLLTVAAVAAAATAVAGDQHRDVPEAKQTTIGLYVTSAEAYERWKATPEQVKILDVRTPEEYIFVGHAPMARNVPLYFQTHEWNSEKGRFTMKPNPDFASQVKAWASPTDTIMVMCRSGGRSAMSVNALAEAGFVHVFNIIDGMEGDKVRDPGSAYDGKRMKNGWKNAGLPWTYKLDPSLVYKPNASE